MLALWLNTFLPDNIKIPNEQTGIKPAMVLCQKDLLKNITQIENVVQIDYLNDHDSLLHMLKQHQQLKIQFEKVLNNNPNLSKNFSELNEILDYIHNSINIIDRQYHNQKDYLEKQWLWVQEQRKQKNFRYGVPPDPQTNQCPNNYPIRVTENLKGYKYKNENYRGIYYTPDDSEYKSEATWCFKDTNEAKLENYRSSKKRKKDK